MSPSAQQQQSADMSDMADDDQKRNANLARIRDNQRRSRARRKEYLTELEEKYRTCEKVGAEASAEIQAAARKVLEENRAILEENHRLRLLLKQSGLSEADIDGWTSDRLETTQHPSAESVELQSMMGTRKPCGPGCSPTNRTVEKKTTTEQKSAGAQSLAPTSHSLLPVQPAIPPYQSPLSVSSDTFTPSSAHFSQTQSYPPLQSAEHTLQPMDYEHFDEALLWHDNFTSPAGTGIAESSSCFVAADAIRTIKPDLGFELEHELGCGVGQECDVPNAQIYGIMDRYTADPITRSVG
ncbi:hypothetical protein LTR86_001724 [Recurvomyces mirabilis]|nr:hypothetical protein LTR86_001724 [Recurvomyces mirabilis]